MLRIATIVAPVALAATIVTLSASATATPLPQRLLTADAIAGYTPASPASKTLTLAGYANKVGLDPKAKKSSQPPASLPEPSRPCTAPHPSPQSPDPHSPQSSSSRPLPGPGASLTGSFAPTPEKPPRDSTSPRSRSQPSPEPTQPTPGAPAPKAASTSTTRSSSTAPSCTTRHLHPRPSTLTREFQAGRQPLLPAPVALVPPTVHTGVTLQHRHSERENPLTSGFSHKPPDGLEPSTPSYHVGWARQETPASACRGLYCDGSPGGSSPRQPRG